MKKSLIIAVGIALVVFACGKKGPDPRYAPDTKEYQFFKTLAEKAPILNPDEANELIRTSAFSIYTNDVMPLIYRQWSRYASMLDKIPPDQVTNFVYYAAKQEAERRLLVLAAEENNVTVADSTLEAEMQKVFASAGGEEAFVKSITGQGLTLDFVRDDIRNSMVARKFLNDTVFDSIQASDQEVEQMYGKDKLATVRHILFSTRGKSEEEKAEIHKKAEEILKRARDGEDFAELAKQFSEDPGSKAKGGLYENFPRGKMVKPFEDASFNLPVGSISDIVETDYGYHIIKVISRSKEEKPLDEVKENLRKSIVDNKKKDVYDSLLKSLKEKYHYEEVFTT